MRHRLKCYALACASLASLGAVSTYATDYYVAPAGLDTNAGTIGSPYGTITKAISSAAAGDTIYLRGGTYNYGSTITISKSGTSAAPYKLYSYAGESPIIDFSTQTGTSRGIQLDSNYWHFKGLTIRNAKDNGIHITGSNNTLEKLDVYGNGDSGVQLSGTSTRKPSNNLIVNVDSHANYDPAGHGENADGFAAKFRDLGTGNVFRGVRAYGNSDDGFDFWAGANGVTVENSWSFRNGNNTFGDTAFAGDGNGIKLGHDSGTHTIKNTICFENVATGIDVNGNATIDTSIISPYVAVPHGVTILNVTSYANGLHNYLFDENYAHIMRNNISVSSGTPLNINAGIDDTFNSWNGAAFSADVNDFISVNSSGVLNARLADGSLPTLDFLRLKNGSNLIDAGANVGGAYLGAAPDLGAFESLPEPTTLGALGIAAVMLRRVIYR